MVCVCGNVWAQQLMDLAIDLLFNIGREIKRRSIYRSHIHKRGGVDTLYFSPDARMSE